MPELPSFPLPAFAETGSRESSVVRRKTLDPGSRSRSPGMTHPFSIAARAQLPKCGGRSWTDASLHQRTLAVLERPKRLIRGNRRANLVIVPRTLRLRRLLDLDQVRGMNLAAVDTNRAFAEQRVVGRRLLHLRDHLGALVALQRLDGLEIVRQRRINAGVDHRRVDALVALGKALGKRPRLIVRVPV